MNTSISTSFEHSSSAISVLLVTAAVGDQAPLCTSFARRRWRLYTASGCLEALALLRQANVPVVICGGHVTDGSWKTLIQATAGLPRPPRVIVSSPLTSLELFDEVRRAGGYGVVQSLDTQEMEVHVQVAWRSWHRQWRNVNTATWKPIGLRRELPAAAILRRAIEN